MTRTYCATAILFAVALWAGKPAVAATILPGIAGTIFHDLDSSGGPSAGEGVGSVSLQLYHDDGDGVFEPGSGDTAVGSPVVSGLDGKYSFDSLDVDAGYFVERPAQVILAVPQAAQVSGLLKPGLPSIVIDAFNENQVVTANPTTPSATSSLSGPMMAVLGGERDLYVEVAAGVGESELRSNAFGLDVLQFDNTSGVQGRAVVTWDGIDGSGSQTPSMGLGGLDLTEGGTNTGIYAKLGIDATGNADLVTFRLYRDDPSTYSQITASVPVSDGTATGTVFLPFANFTGPVTANDVDAIQMLIGGVAKSVDAQVDSVFVLGPETQHFEVVPEPSAMALALLSSLGLLGLRRRISFN